MIERQTAKKVRIKDIMQGKWVKKEGFDPSFIVTPYGEKVSRTRVMATVVNKFVNEDETFCSITIDDTTDTIRAKTFKTVAPLGDLKEGDLVDLIGKVREYNDEVYIIPEVVYKVANPNMLFLRKLELIKKLKDWKREGRIEVDEEDISKEVDSEKVRNNILSLLEANPNGMSYDELMDQVGEKEEVIEPVINTLLSEGICYEPIPGKLKKI